MDISIHIQYMEGLNHVFILGVDFLCSYNATLQFSETNTMHIPSNNDEANACLNQRIDGTIIVVVSCGFKFLTGTCIRFHEKHQYSSFSDCSGV